MTRLTIERKRRGLSRAALARSANLNAVTVGQIESQRFRPYPVQLEKLAAALEWRGDPAALLDEVQHVPGD